jgi:hypothetical protein
MNDTNLFGRIGTTQVVNEKAEEAIMAGATVKRDRDAGTVSATFGEEIVFKALRKGTAGQPWIVMYSPKYYSR